MANFIQTVKTNRPLIGMVHLAPLLGVKDHPGMEFVIETGLKDALAIQNAGFDALIIENNYDLPHDIFVNPNVTASFTYAAQIISEKINIPFGICVLWNDYKTALSIAKLVGACFVRVPVFVDQVMTSYGRVDGNAEDTINFRKNIQAENISILTDIQVKHSELLNKRPIGESASEALQKHSDGLIVTGKWTGDAPKTDDLDQTRKAAKSAPIIIGSGADINNLDTLLKYADGIIVGTSIKDGAYMDKTQNVNLKGFDQRISLEKAKAFKKKFEGCLDAIKQS